MDGILVVNKPKGMTSHDVVSKLRRIYNMKKVGHTGTLDPEVEGVMVVCFGKATKLVPFLTASEKQYTCEICIGKSTDTEDLTGAIISETFITESKAYQLSKDLPLALDHFIGTYEQIPPMYSAVKVNGKKLYEYARKGIEVERPKRLVEIIELKQEPLSFRYEDGCVYYTFNVLVSKGTFIRTLCVDIGEKLGLPAAMSKLQRNALAAYDKSCAIDLAIIERDKPAFIHIDAINLPLPEVKVATDVADKLANGYKLPMYFVEQRMSGAFTVRDETTNALIGIFQPSDKYSDKYESIRVI